MGSVRSLFHRKYDTVKAVDDISFTIAEGELVGFIGPNGAGKTTTLKCLSGLLYPTSGLVSVLGFTPFERKNAYLKQIALVMGQKNQLWWDLPAQETFLLNKEIYEISDDEYKKTLGILVELLDVESLLKVQVRKLSLGERMKMELIAALIHSPKVLFLDEPTIGLDVVSQQNMREFLKKYNALKKTTILLTSHYMEDVEALCKRIIIINDGVIIFDGQLDDLMKKYVHHKVVTLSFTKPVLREDLAKLGKIREFQPQYVVLEVPDRSVKERAAKILTTMPVDDILIDEAPVEEVIRTIFDEARK